MNNYTDTAYQPQEENSPKHPGGTTNRVMWNEKVLLDSYVMGKAMAPAPGSLPANHDSFKQGIYTTNSVGDYD